MSTGCLKAEFSLAQQPAARQPAPFGLFLDRPADRRMTNDRFGPVLTRRSESRVPAVWYWQQGCENLVHGQRQNTAITIPFR